VIALFLISFQVSTGLDALVDDGFARLKGRRVAVLTNHSAIDRNGVHLTEHLKRSGLAVTAFLAPEHGFEGLLDRENIAHGRDRETGLQIYSLYGETKRPTPEMLAGADTLLFDIQDIGTRFYTYQTTMLYAMQACAEAGLRFIVLDRPNPIGGERVAGPMLDADQHAFTGAFPMPVVHGMTMGELARMFRSELSLDLQLEVIVCKGWRREMGFAETGLIWIDPSPNMRNVKQAILYPAIGLLERTNLSVGRGTDAPFERFGAPWLVPAGFCRELNAIGLPGIRFIPHFFTPTSGPYANERCGGPWLMLEDGDRFEPIRTAYTIYRALREIEAYDDSRFGALLVNDRTLSALRGTKPIDAILEEEKAALEQFHTTRSEYLIY